MDNPETLATLGTQETGWGQKKSTHTTQGKTQHRKLKKWATRTPPKTRDEPRCSRKVSSFCYTRRVTGIYI